VGSHRALPGGAPAKPALDKAQDRPLLGMAPVLPSLVHIHYAHLGRQLCCHELVFAQLRLLSTLVLFGRFGGKREWRPIGRHFVCGT